MATVQHTDVIEIKKVAKLHYYIFFVKSRTKFKENLSDV